MRNTINEYLKNTKHNIEFIHNDLWNFDSRELSFVKNFKSAENMIWGYSYGLTLKNIFPIIYSVSYFNIGRLEQFRKFFLLKNTPFLILNAGHVGYDDLPAAHRFTYYYEEDSLFNEYRIPTYDHLKLNTREKFIEILDDIIKNKKRGYIKLGKDGLYD